jgi:hypothetical protein
MFNQSYKLLRLTRMPFGTDLARYVAIFWEIQ